MILTRSEWTTVATALDESIYDLTSELRVLRRNIAFALTAPSDLILVVMTTAQTEWIEATTGLVTYHARQDPISPSAYANQEDNAHGG